MRWLACRRIAATPSGITWTAARLSPTCAGWRERCGGLHEGVAGPCGKLCSFDTVFLKTCGV